MVEDKRKDLINGLLLTLCNVVNNRAPLRAVAVASLIDPDSSAHLQALVTTCEAFVRTRRIDQSREVLRQMVSHRDAETDRVAIHRYGALQALFDRNQNLALDEAMKGVALCRDIRSPREEMSALFVLGQVQFGLRHIDDALETIEKTLFLAHQMGFKIQYAWGLAELSRCHLSKGNVDQATLSVLKAIAMADEIGDPFSSTFSMIHLSHCQLASGDFETSLGSGQIALERSKALSNESRTLFCSVLIASARVLTVAQKIGLEREEQGAKERRVLMDAKATFDTADERLAEDRNEPTSIPVFTARALCEWHLSCQDTARATARHILNVSLKEAAERNLYAPFLELAQNIVDAEC